MTSRPPLQLPLGEDDSGRMLELTVGHEWAQPVHLVLGGPGAGKSTLLNHLAFAAHTLDQARVGMLHEDGTATLLDPNDLAEPVTAATPTLAARHLWDRLYHHQDGHHPVRLLAIDGAGQVEPSMLELAARTGRSLGIAVVITTDDPDHLNLVSDPASLTYLGCSTPEAHRRLAATFGINATDLAELAMGPAGHGLHMGLTREVKSVTVPNIDLVLA